uniref:Uncharacterized protein n=1 Tax=Hyaloperonospora arabidopsidis (strain Emoy2) TaxID=559515 RepID=M4BQ80_HYAAE
MLKKVKHRHSHYTSVCTRQKPGELGSTMLPMILEARASSSTASIGRRSESDLNFHGRVGTLTQSFCLTFMVPLASLCPTASLYLKDWRSGEVGKSLPGKLESSGTPVGTNKESEAHECTDSPIEPSSGAGGDGIGACGDAKVSAASPLLMSNQGGTLPRAAL